MAQTSRFTKVMADAICEQIMQGKSLRRICTAPNMPAASTVYKWLNAHAAFVEQYARAKEVQADVLAEQIIDIADDGSNDTYTDDDGNERTNQDVIARSRLRVDARKWYASKLAPKKYGDKLQQEVSGLDGAPLGFVMIPAKNGD